MSARTDDRNNQTLDHNQEVMSPGVALKKSAFLAAYAKTCSIMAAEVAGIDRRTHYRWLKDPTYKE